MILVDLECHSRLDLKTAQPTKGSKGILLKTLVLDVRYSLGSDVEHTHYNSFLFQLDKQGRLVGGLREFHRLQLCSDTKNKIQETLTLNISEADLATSFYIYLSCDRIMDPTLGLHLISNLSVAISDRDDHSLTHYHCDQIPFILESGVVLVVAENTQDGWIFKQVMEATVSGVASFIEANKPVWDKYSDWLN